MRDPFHPVTTRAVSVGATALPKRHTAGATAAIACVLALMLTAALSPALAQTPTPSDAPQRLADFIHSAWSLKEEAPTFIVQIAQTPDGDLWLATSQGAYRFDGVKFVQFQTNGVGSLATESINTIFVASSKDVWIGYHGGGISRIHNGQITTFTAGIPPGPVGRIAESRDGTIWAATFGGIAFFRSGVWKTIPWADEYGRAYNLLVARDGVVWIAGEHQLLFLMPGSEKIETTPIELAYVRPLEQAPDGRLWISDAKWGLRVFDPDQVLRSPGQLRLTPPPRKILQVRGILFDHDGQLWGSYYDGSGIFRILHPELVPTDKPLSPADVDESFGAKDGLTSDTAAPVFEDREHNIWIGTESGLDRFRRADIIANRTLPMDVREGYRAVVGSSGEFYAADEDTIFHVDPPGNFKAIGHDPSHPNEFCAAPNGVVWLSDRQGLLRIVNDEISRIALPLAARKGEAYGCAVDAHGTLWLSVVGVGILTYDNGLWSGPLPIPLPKKFFPRLLAADHSGGIWACDRGLSLFLIKDHRLRSFSTPQGLQVGEIKTVFSNASGTFVGGELGIAKLNGERFETLKTDKYPELSTITGITQDAEGDTWLNGVHGLMRLRTDDLLKAIAQPGLPLNLRRFDFRDGVPGMAQTGCCHATALTDQHDRVWFINTRGIAWVDPRRVTFNALPPPVQIRSVTVNGRVLAPANHMRLPPSTPNLSFDFDALSLAIPERVRFRYRLEGWDSDWQDGGNRRQAFYTNLSPGNYRFHVIACNNSGVWNDTGASFDFAIAPHWYQTSWFTILSLLATGCLLWGIYALRLRQVTAEIGMRLEERIHERERIARELHDTLLQDFQAVILRFQQIANRLLRTDPNRVAVEEGLDYADKVLAEGRNHIRNIRADSRQPDELSKSLAAYGEELSQLWPLKFTIAVTGAPIDLYPVVRDELHRIGREAICNAFKHSNGSRVQVTLAYRKDTFHLSVCDDGVGISIGLLEEGRPGHWGINNMRERALRIGARLAFDSGPDAGTCLHVKMPARLAAAPARFRFPWRWNERHAAGPLSAQPNQRSLGIFGSSGQAQCVDKSRE